MYMYVLTLSICAWFVATLNAPPPQQIPTTIHNYYESILIQMSWVKTLKNRFKNIRRIPRQIRTGLEFGLPTRKAEKSLKASFHPIPQVSGKLLDDATYGRHRATLEKKQKKTTKSQSTITSLMRETCSNRRKWITEDMPSVAEVVNEFPQLKTYAIVSYS